MRCGVADGPVGGDQGVNAGLEGRGSDSRCGGLLLFFQTGKPEFKALEKGGPVRGHRMPVGLPALVHFVDQRLVCTSGNGGVH